MNNRLYVGAYCLLVAIGDAPTGEVVGRDLYDDPVTRKDSDIVHANLSRDCAEDGLTVFKLHFEHGVGQRLNYRPFELDSVLFTQPFAPFPSNDRTT